jgi:hypothetical protein
MSRVLYFSNSICDASRTFGRRNDLVHHAILPIYCASPFRHNMGKISGWICSAYSGSMRADIHIPHKLCETKKERNMHPRQRRLTHTPAPENPPRCADFRIIIAEIGGYIIFIKPLHAYQTFLYPSSILSYRNSTPFGYFVAPCRDLQNTTKGLAKVLWHFLTLP